MNGEEDKREDVERKGREERKRRGIKWNG